MTTERKHTIRVRWNGSTHQAIDDKSWVKCTSTSGHREAVRALLKKQGITGKSLRRAAHLEKGMHDPKRADWEQWQVFLILTDVHVCRECGCTDDDCSGCIERTGRPCSWVETDLCSACAE